MDCTRSAYLSNPGCWVVGSVCSLQQAVRRRDDVPQCRLIDSLWDPLAHARAWATGYGESGRSCDCSGQHHPQG